jgi:hypothetical protein
VSVSATGVSSAIDVDASAAVGASFTGVTVIETVPSSDELPSETRKRTESGPW